MLKPVPDRPSSPRLQRTWRVSLYLPALVFAVSVVVAFVMHGRFVQTENDTVHMATAKRLDSIRDQFLQAIEDRLRSLERMARRLDYSDRPNREAWMADANIYRHHMRGLDSVAVLDTKNEIRWLSKASNEAEIQLRSVSAKVWNDAIETARLSKEVTVSSRILNYDAEPTFLVVLPLYYNGRWIGSLVSMNKLDAFLETFIHYDGYKFSVTEKDSTIFENFVEGYRQDENAAWAHDITFPVVNHSWKFQLTPLPAMVASHRTNLPLFVFVAAIMTGILLSVVIHLLLRLRLRSKVVEEQRHFLDNVIDGLPVAVFCNDHDDNYRFTVWNLKAEEIFGIPKSQALGKTPKEVFGREYAQSFHEIRGFSDAAAKTTVFEEEFPSNSGAILLHTQRISIENTRSSSFTSGYTIGISEDITERRRAETALKDSEQKFSVFLENAPALTWVRNNKGEFTFASSKFCETFGTTPAAILGRRTIPGAGQDIQQRGAENDLKVLRELRNVSVVENLIDSVGRSRHFLVMKFPMRLPSGADLVGATAVDITDRVEAEKVLSNTTKTLRALIDASPLPILTLDLEGRVKIWSPACQAVFGWNEAEVIGGPLPFVPPEKREESRGIIKRIIQSGRRGFSTDATRVRRDGSTIETRVEGMVLNDENTGEPVGLVAVVSDISDQKLAKAQLQAAKEQAELTAKIKADFLANVSHEIRTPLNGIIGMTDILIESGLNDEQAKYATIVRNSGGVLLNLINDILDLSKIEAGKMTLEKTTFSPVNLVETHADLLIAKAREKNISLMTYVDTGLPSQVIGDPARIAQVLMNLVGNAIKFTADGGITVRAMKLPAENSKDPNALCLRIEVSDTGIGLDEDAREKLFQPFVQADSSTNRRFGGTGLGLSISKNLVEAMGGTIGVDSRVGFGSTFWFNVPIEASVCDAFPLTRDIKDLDRARILIVDEDKIATDVIERYLGSWGIQNHASVTHQNAISRIMNAESRAEGFDVVLVSQDSKNSVSRSLITELREQIGLRAPKVVLMTAFESHIPNDVATSSEFAAVISKPLKQSQLFDCLARVLLGNKLSKTSPVATRLATRTPIKKSETSLNVLVADDVSTNQIIAVKLLESLGHSGHAVANGREAIEALKLRQYDLVLMDCQMPDMDGFEATKLIRQSTDPQIANTVIIALTANAMDGDREICIAAGMNDYLSKPIRKDRLAEALNRWIPELKKPA